MRRFAFIGLLALSASSASAQADKCDVAIGAYNEAVRSVGSAMDTYARCVDSGRGKDDCGWKFRELQSKHSNFQDAVRRIGFDCR